MTVVPALFRKPSAAGAVLGGLFALASAHAHALGNQPAEASLMSGNRYSTHEVEAYLARTLTEIRQNRVDAALKEINKALQTYPNFRLGYLIKGDLLLARARPLSTIGDATGARADALGALREEARVRLARYQAAVPSVSVPKYLVQLSPEQNYALVVDTSKASIYLYENRAGALRYVADYYVTVGKNGVDKYRAGDGKTPLGVYNVTRWIPGQKLPDLYGAGALPIDYPNEWDKREGRGGHGIWLHGTSKDTYSRPPRASDGCVGLSNQDFEAIVRNVRVGVTPVVLANGIEWVSPQMLDGIRKDLGQRIEAWRRDWESLDVERFLSHYSIRFASGKTTLASWAGQKRQANAGKSWAKVNIDKLSILLYPGRDDLAVVTFEQEYSSSNLSDSTSKRQYWAKENGGWKIIYEGPAGAAPARVPSRTG